MRCDHPRGYDDEYLEPACEIFLQLFLQNAQIAANEETQDNEGAVNADFGGYETDDSFSFPSLHTISDGSLSSGESSGDEGEGLIIGTIHQESNYQEIFGENSVDVLFESVPSRNPEDDAEKVNAVIENTDVLCDHHQVTENSLNSENSDNISNVAFQETGDCAGNSSNDLLPANETVCFEESSAQTDIYVNNNISSSPVNTYVSLYVVVPPTSFSDNLLSEVSSDELNSDAVPVNSPSTSSFVSDNGNTPLEDESLHTVNKIHDNLEGLASDSSAVSSSLSVTENDKDHVLELNFASGIEDSVSSECTEGFDGNSHPFITINADSSEEMNLQQYSNANCDAISDKSVPSLKRKVVGSVDGDILNKVPKYSLSHESNESVNEVSLDNYCNELSNDNEISKLCDEDKIDTVPTTINVENAILPLGNTEENSVIEQQTL